MNSHLCFRSLCTSMIGLAGVAMANGASIP